MSRRTKIVLAVTLLITATVSVFAYVYISQMLRQRVMWADETVGIVAATLAYDAKNAVPDLTSTRVDTTNPEKLRIAIKEYLQTDTNLNGAVQSAVSNAAIVYDVAVLDANGRALLHSNPTELGKLIAERPPFRLLRDEKFQRQLRWLYGPLTVYDVNLPLELDGAPFGTVRVGVSTVFLRREITPLLQRSLYLGLAAIALALLLGAGVAHLALGPLKELSRNLDSMSAGAGETLDGPQPRQDEYGRVTSKIADLGRQMRDTNQIFSALKDNVEQVMTKLQDGLMLFTRDGRVVLVSASAERFLGRPRREILGRTAEEIFADGSPLGETVLRAFRSHQTVRQRELDGQDGRRLEVSVDFIQERGTPIGGLLTIRDAESVRRIGDEIELSRRLSASGRVTRNVGHEVKNPINAISLHLQLLQNKLQQAEPDTRRHLDVIGSEIHRLDRVVQILVDFTRPHDLKLEELDLRKLLENTIVLTGPDARQHGVVVMREFPDEPLLVKVDSDLMKQAVLNIVLNAVQAMPEGGILTVAARREEGMVVAEIRDQGPGMPTEIRERVFELYFTTKKDGSGIGLAQTYQIMQWHFGSVEFDSAEGPGTTCRLRLPGLEIRQEAAVAAGQEAS